MSRIPEWYLKLEAEPMSQAALDSLLDYSCSLPTATTIGKVWKRNLRFGTGDPEPLWMICEYAEKSPPDPDRVAILRRRPVITDAVAS